MSGTLTQSLCRLCMGSCGMLVTTNEAGRLEAVQGDKSHPVSLGYACFTGVQSPDAHNSPDRLLHPLKRMPDGSFAEIPLEQALDEIADRLRRIIARDGGKAIASFRGTGNPGNVAASAMVSAWHAAIGSAASFSTMTIDQSAKWVTAERLGVWGAGRNNFHESDVIMLVGGNPLVSNTVIGFPCSNPVKQLREARQRGTKLIVIDPRLTETAKHADVFLQPIPGEDVAVAAGLLRIILSERWEDRAFCDSHAETLTELRQSIDPFTPELVEQRAGIAAAKLHEAARVFAKESRRGFVVTGTGPDMGPHSNLAEHLYESLNVVCGRYRRAGDLVVNPILAGPHRVRYAEVVPPGRSFEKGHNPASAATEPSSAR
jgi:anaerobic selenocysteine-containing dehydrogenase